MFYGRRLFLDREIGRVENLTDFDHIARVRWAALGPFHELFFRLGLDHPIAAEHFLGFNEGAVGYGRFAFAERDACAGGERMQAVE